MQTFYGDLFHLIRNCVIAIASKPVRLHTHDKVRAQVVGQAVKLENVALAIADVDAAIRSAEKTNRLPQIFQPPHAFLLLDGNSRRIDLPLERRRSLEPAGTAG
jgi:hypothetical protein